MKLRLTSKIDLPVVDWLGGPSGPFSSTTPDISLFLSEADFDVYLCPHDLFDLRHNKKYLDSIKVLASERFVIVSNRGDQPIHLCDPRIISIQTSIEVGQNCNRHPTVIVPYNIEFFSDFNQRNYSKEPAISFVGYVPSITPRRVWRSIFPLPMHPIKRNGALLRRIGLRYLGQIPNILVRSHDSYSATYRVAREEPERRERYLNSLRQSDFIFAPRGDGNSSQRLYETLAHGRIAIVPDSNMVFPNLLKPFIGRFFLITKPTSRNLFELIDRFWKELDDSRYLALQGEIFNFFSNSLQYKKFIENLFRVSLDELLDQYLVN